MLPVALGVIPVPSAGTPVRLSTPADTAKNLPQARDLWANRIVVGAPITTTSATGNTGAVYIGVQGMVKATGVGVLITLLPGDTSPITVNSWGNKIWVPGLFVDADVSGEGVTVYVETD